MLRGRLILAPFEGWRRDPSTYTGPITGGLFTLFLQRLTSEAERVEAAVSRLARAGAAVDAGIANLDPALAHPLIVERGLGAARAPVRYVRDLVWQDVEDAALRERLRAAGEAAAPHLERWVAHLEASCRGRRHVAARRGGLHPDPPRARGPAATTPARCASAAGRSSSASTRRWRALAARRPGTPTTSPSCARTTRNHPPTEEAMLETYAAWTARRRAAFLAETGLVTLPEGETCAVVPSPVFQRPVLGVASYVAPPAFSDSLKGHFFVPFAPDGASDEEIQSRLSNNSYGGDPHDGRARGVPRPPLAPGHAQGQPVATCARCTRRRTSPRAGPCTRSG